MEVIPWIASHWLDLVQTGGIVAAFLVVRNAILWDARIRQIGNSIKLTEHHRMLWERFLADPNLQRVLHPNPNLPKFPVTPAEEMFVIFLIIHMSDTFYAAQTGFYPRPQGMAEDVQQILSLPIPYAVWENVKDLQEPEFVDFVERRLDPEGDSPVKAT